MDWATWMIALTFVIAIVWGIVAVIGSKKRY
jgi:hypothetical protein